MPSYRVVLTVGQVRASISAPDVQPMLGAVIAQHTTVEANDLRISAGRPQIIIRFTGADPHHARAVVQESLADLDAVIEIQAFEVLARSGTRWLPL